MSTGFVPPIIRFLVFFFDLMNDICRFDFQASKLVVQPLLVILEYVR